MLLRVKEESGEELAGFVEACRARGARVETGRFRTTMKVELCNDGPVTLIWDDPPE